jgi:hypothetical protein
MPEFKEEVSAENYVSFGKSHRRLPESQVENH